MKRLITIAVLGLAGLTWLSSNVASAFVYDRSAILSGEVWRIATGNLVHFSKTHFWYDLLAFAMAGFLIEFRGHRGLGWFCLISPLLIGLTVLLTQPHLEIFGGLSGVAIGALALLSMNEMRQPGSRRWIWVLALIGLAVKTGVEFSTGEMVFARSEGLVIKPVPLGHLAGGVAAALVWIFQRDTTRSPGVCVALESGRALRRI